MSRVGASQLWSGEIVLWTSEPLDAIAIRLPRHEEDEIINSVLENACDRASCTYHLLIARDDEIKAKQIEALAAGTDQEIKVHLNARTEEVLGDGTVSGLNFSDGRSLACDLLVFCTGIRPRDELAKERTEFQ